MELLVQRRGIYGVRSGRAADCAAVLDRVGQLPRLGVQSDLLGCADWAELVRRESLWRGMRCPPATDHLSANPISFRSSTG